jgi:hypothetical protein
MYESNFVVAGLLLVAALVAAPTAAADPTESPCSGPGEFNEVPGPCQDPYPTNAVPVPPGPGPGSDGNWGVGLPCSTDPRWAGCPGSTPDQNFLMNVTKAGVASSQGPQALIRTGHAVCNDLSHGYTYQQEANTIMSKTNLTSGQAISIVEAAQEFYCPTL